MDDLSLRGLVLAARPELLDPNFQHALVYLADHHAGGAFGVVLNRPTGRKLGELMSDPTDHPPALHEVPVFLGGPVERDKVLLVAFEQGQTGPSDVRCRLDLAKEDIAGFQEDPGHWVRAFLGFAGWGEGQLESELADRTWHLCEPSPALFDDRFGGRLWDLFVSSDQRWRGMLPYLPEDPSRN